MSQSIRFGIMCLQNLPYPTLRERWQQVEALGWDSVWIGDHFVDPFAPHAPWYEAWSLLGALAESTHTIRFGALVNSLTLRNPALLARNAMTLDHISQGRLELGLGAAGRPLDYSMTGLAEWDKRERAGRFRECVELVDQLLRQEVTDYAGRYYHVKGAVVNPRALQQPRPPLTLAAHGPSTLKTVARYADTWNSLGKAGVSADEALQVTRERNEMLDEMCAQIGRDPKTVVRSFLCGFTPDRPFASLDAFHEFVGRYHAIGINEFIFYWMSKDTHPLFPEGGLQGMRITDLETLERYSRDALPALRRLA